MPSYILAENILLNHFFSGTSRGFRIYHTDPFSKCFESTEGNIVILEMLFSTSLVAFVLSPRRLQIKNTKVRSRVLVVGGHLHVQ